MNANPKTFLLIAAKAESCDGLYISAETLAARRLRAGRWGLYAKTPHKSELRTGDQLIVYLAGEGERRFVASATVSEVDFKDQSNDADGDALTDLPVAILKLREVRNFKNHVSIIDIKDRLDFIPKSTTKWGCVLQRGLKRLSEADANTIMEASR